LRGRNGPAASSANAVWRGPVVTIHPVRTLVTAAPAIPVAAAEINLRSETMMPTGTPYQRCPGPHAIFAGLANSRRWLLSLSVICGALAVGTGANRADDPGEAADPAAAEAEDHKAASPPGGDEAVLEPPDWSIHPEEGLPPAAAGSPPRLRCDDCCGGCDECCPIVGGDWECFDRDLSCFAAGCDGCDSNWCNPDARFYVGLEFGVLQPEVGRLRIPGSANPTSIKPDHGFEFAPRVFAGFQTCEGWGGQISHWTLETGASRTDVPQVFQNLDLQTVDVDFTKTGTVGEWLIQIGAGGRWGDIESNTFSIVDPNQRLQTDFEGTGPTAVLNVRRPLGCGNWALVGEGRASFLYGTTNLNTPLAPNLQLGSDWVEIWEGRAGIEWNGPSASGDAVFFVRALFEGQYWNMPSLGAAGSSDMNFLGPTLSVGFVF
jgi:hypothetical protein